MAKITVFLFLYLDFMVSALSVLLEEFALDGSFARFGLLATTPVIFCVSIVGLLLFYLWYYLTYTPIFTF